MKIAIINQHFENIKGGSELQCDLIAEALVKKSHEVFYIAPKGENKQYSRTYSVLPTENNADSIISAVKQVKPEIVYWRYNKHHFFKVARFLNKHDIPLVFAVSHILDLKPFAIKRFNGLRSFIKQNILKIINHLGFRYVQAITVNNEAFLKHIKIENKFYIPNGIPDNRSDFTWPKPYCAWVGSLKTVKRPELMVALAKEFQKTGIDFLIAGKIQEQSYEWLKSSSNLPLNCYYLGEMEQEKILGLLKNALVHISTSFPEGFPNVFIQSWVNGTPTVSYQFDPNNLIKEKNLGFCANADWDEFVNNVKLITKDDTLRENLRSNIMQYATEEFNNEKSVEKLEDIFKLLVNRNHKIS